MLDIEYLHFCKKTGNLLQEIIKKQNARKVLIKKKKKKYVENFFGNI